MIVISDSSDNDCCYAFAFAPYYIYTRVNYIYTRVNACENTAAAFFFRCKIRAKTEKKRLIFGTFSAFTVYSEESVTCVKHCVPRLTLGKNPDSYDEIAEKQSFPASFRPFACSFAKDTGKDGRGNGKDGMARGMTEKTAWPQEACSHAETINVRRNEASQKFRLSQGMKRETGEPTGNQRAGQPPFR